MKVGHMAPKTLRLAFGDLCPVYGSHELVPGTWCLAIRGRRFMSGVQTTLQIRRVNPEQVRLGTRRCGWMELTYGGPER